MTPIRHIIVTLVRGPAGDTGNGARRFRPSDPVNVLDRSTDLAREVVFQVDDLGVHYGPVEALSGVNMEIDRNCVTAIIGPSGSARARSSAA